MGEPCRYRQCRPMLHLVVTDLMGVRGLLCMPPSDPALISRLSGSPVPLFLSDLSDL